MSLYKQARSLPKRFRLILSSFLQQPGLSFANALPEDAIQKAFDDEDAGFADDAEAVYTPAITLWAFLSQVLFKDEQRSCVAAVVRVSALLIALQRGPCSSNTGAYCRARGKLSETVLRRLTVELANGCERQLDEAPLWHGRHVRIVDGTTVSMPDTPDNQEAYPQARTQQKGLGFPVARVVVLLSLATGMLTDMAMGPYVGKETGETALLRQLFERFRAGDILVADRYFCSYFMIALLQEMGIDFVTRVHQLRTVDFRRGRRLGKGDHIVQWPRPQKPTWMAPQAYDRMPASLEVREVHVCVGEPGFRAKSFVVVSTLTDEAAYPESDSFDLYHCRWLVELDIRAIKVTMGMDVLRCKTPEMVRREMWTCLLAYNLIRQTMLQAAQKTGVSPRTLSFTVAVQTIATSWMLIILSDGTLATRLIDAASVNLAQHIVGNRPGRIEPRAIKRRPKPHDLLTKPRHEARAQLMGDKPR